MFKFLLLIFCFFASSDILLEKKHKMHFVNPILIVSGARINSKLNLPKGVMLAGVIRGKDNGFKFVLKNDFEHYVEKEGGLFFLKFRKKKNLKAESFISVEEINFKTKIKIKTLKKTHPVIFQDYKNLYIFINEMIKCDAYQNKNGWKIEYPENKQTIITIPKKSRMVTGAEKDDEKNWVIKISPESSNFKNFDFVSAKVEKVNDSISFEGCEAFEVLGTNYLAISHEQPGKHISFASSFPSFKSLKTIQGVLIDKRKANLNYQVGNNSVFVFDKYLSNKKFKPEDIVLPKKAKMIDLYKLDVKMWPEYGIYGINYLVKQQRFKDALNLYIQIVNKLPFLESDLVWNFYGGFLYSLNCRYQKAILNIYVNDSLIDSKLWFIYSKILLNGKINNEELSFLIKNWKKSQTSVKQLLGLVLSDYLKFLGYLKEAKLVLSNVSKMDLKGEIKKYFFALDGFMNRKLPYMIINSQRGKAISYISDLKVENNIKKDMFLDDVTKVREIKNFFQGSLIGFESTVLLSDYYFLRGFYVHALNILEESLLYYPDKINIIIGKITKIINHMVYSDKVDFLEKIALLKYSFPWVVNFSDVLFKVIKKGIDQGFYFNANIVLDNYRDIIYFDDNLNKLNLEVKVKLDQYDDAFLEILSLMNTKDKPFYLGQYYYHNNKMDDLKKVAYKYDLLGFKVILAFKFKEYSKLFYLLSKYPENNILCAKMKVLCAFFLNSLDLFKKLPDLPDEDYEKLKYMVGNYLLYSDYSFEILNYISTKELKLNYFMSKN